MRIKYIALFAVLVLVISVGACTKEADEPIVAQQQSGAASGNHPATDATPSFAPVTEIVIPDDVKGKWQAVILVIEDKGANKTKSVTIPLNTDHTIADSTVKIQVGDFIPDFRMEGTTITSASAEPNNPAVHITVFDGDQEIFKSWLYSRFPAIHPFEHEKFGITLRDGVANGG